MQGWVKLHRKFIGWEWYKDANVMRLFVHCLLKANHQDNNWQGNMIKRGSFITSLDTLSHELGLSVKQIRTAISKLERTNEVAKKGQSKFTVIQIVNYEEYQEEGKQEGTQKANKGQTKGKQRATNKNDKKDNNDNNEEEYYYSKGNLKLSEEEKEKICQKYDILVLDEYISRVENWKNKHKVKSLYLTVLNWIRKDEKQNQSLNTNQQTHSTDGVQQWRPIRDATF